MSALLDTLLPASKLAEAQDADRATAWRRILDKQIAERKAKEPPPAVRDQSLTWARVMHPVLGSVHVGGEYDAGEPARVTSTAAFVMTGDPGSPGEPAEFVACEVWAQDANGTERNVWAALHDLVLDELAKLALVALQSPDAEVY
jgi:hypothetical protein